MKLNLKFSNNYTKHLLTQLVRKINLNNRKAFK